VIPERDRREYDEPDHVCPESERVEPEPFVDIGTKDVRDEITAISEAYEALRGLSHDGQARAMRWLASKLGVDLKENDR
jgi:hypothetical protein